LLVGYGLKCARSSAAITGYQKTCVMPSRRTRELATSFSDWTCAFYGLRKQTVEPVLGIIKHAMRFRQFLLRGKAKFTGEWQLVSLAYNLKRLHGLADA
jgi:hypothetical protein